MKPLELLKRLATIFENERCQYCLIGGHAASLYRAQERFTKDIDFALLAEPSNQSLKVAQKVLKSVGLEPVAAFIPPAPGEISRKSVCMVTSKPKGNEIKGMVDILLPILPWVEFVVKRAQYNKIDLGSVKVPTITPEDLIITKCYALNNSPDRFQDLDDLKEIFQYVLDLDLDYLREKLKEMNLSIPKPIQKYSRLKI